MKSQPTSGIEQLKNLIRSPYAWPGGYPLFAIMGDGAALCKDCAETEFKTILSDTMQGYGASFQVVAIDANWENSDLYCCHCSGAIESAYGDRD